MPSMKIYPPAQLPDRDVTETQFNIWQEELEVYLLQEKDFAVFLKDGSYDEWETMKLTTTESRLSKQKILLPLMKQLVRQQSKLEQAMKLSSRTSERISEQLFPLLASVCPRDITTASSSIPPAWSGSTRCPE